MSLTYLLIFFQDWASKELCSQHDYQAGGWPTAMDCEQNSSQAVDRSDKHVPNILIIADLQISKSLNRSNKKSGEAL